MKFICVCKYCLEHATDEASIEFNFRDNKIYFVCPKCRKINELDLNNSKSTPFPKSRRI